jgi:hypothetical protein
MSSRVPPRRTTKTNPASDETVGRRKLYEMGLNQSKLLMKWAQPPTVWKGFALVFDAVDAGRRNATREVRGK